MKMMLYASPQLAASRPMGSARGMETAAARSSVNRSPSTPLPALLAQVAVCM